MPNHRLSVALIVALALPLASAAETVDQAAEVERARAMIEEGQRMRTEADARFRVAEYECYQRYFVNRCINRARQARLDVVREARKLEIAGREIELAAHRQRIEERGLPETIGDYRPDPTPFSGITTLPTDDIEAAESLRAFREAERQRAEAQAARERSVRDAERAAQRAEAEAEAARRAEQAERDRERYDERLRRVEEENR